MGAGGEEGGEKEETKEDKETACRKLVTTAITAVKDECTELQKTIDAHAKDNAGCCKAGLDGIDTAKKAHAASEKKHGTCKEEEEKVQLGKVSFGDISYASLSKASCGKTFFDESPAYQAQHKKVEAKKAECVTVKGETDGLKKAIGDAEYGACEERTKCDDTAIKQRDTTYNEAHKACGSVKNQNDWERSHHIQCILDGKKLGDCKVPPGISSDIAGSAKGCTVAGLMKGTPKYVGTSTYSQNKQTSIKQNELGDAACASKFAGSYAASWEQMQKFAGHGNFPSKNPTGSYMVPNCCSKNCHKFHSNIHKRHCFGGSASLKGNGHASGYACWSGTRATLCVKHG